MTTSKLVSRRLLLSTAAAIGSGTTFVGLVHAQAVPAAAPGAAALAKLSNLDASVASALTDNFAAAKAAGAGLAHKGLVRRVVMPALLRNPKNPHFVPQGAPLSPSEQSVYRAQAATVGTASYPGL